jgi:hypothetical protein
LTKLPVAAFVALVVATVAALINGYPAPSPSTINPVSGGVCKLRGPDGPVLTSFRQTRVSFYLQGQGDNVTVFVDSGGNVIRTLPGSGVYMRVGRRHTFVWNGRVDNGTFAPAGTYTLRVALYHQAREFPIANQNTGEVEPVTVERTPAPLRITAITAPGLAAGAPVMVPLPATGTEVTIHYTGTSGLRPRVLIYRTDLPGGPVLVKSYAATSQAGHSLWNGTLAGGRPAPQGTYLVTLRLTDRACTTVTFPARFPPAAGTTAHAGVTIRYLAAQPPLDPVPAGGEAEVGVDARGHAYHWTLQQAGARAVLGAGTTAAHSLAVHLPGDGAGLYVLSLRWGDHSTAVPLVASAPRGARALRVLVVLPALTWQGLDPVDDNDDGLPNVLTGDEPVRLARPLVDGLPAGLGDEAALLAYLRRTGRSFDLTTDLALIDSTGPQLSGHGAVVLAGDEEWVPDGLATTLSDYVEQGGHVLSLGIASMLRGVTISGGEALDPTAPRSADALLARPGAVTATHGAPILVASDGLGIFSGTAQAFSGFASYQPILSVQAPASIASAAGVSSSQPAIAGYRLGHGVVVDIGLPGFVSALSSSLDDRQLLDRIWTVVSG